MHQYFENFGLENLRTEPIFPILIQYVLEEGKFLPGYRCAYMYKNLGRAEIIATLAPTKTRDKVEILALNTHLMGNCFWKLRVAYSGILRGGNTKTDPYTYAVSFQDMKGNHFAPVNVIRADVIPSFLEGDVVELQMAAFPYKVGYYPDGEAYNQTLNLKACGLDVEFADGIFALGSFSENEEVKDTVLIKGPIENIEEFQTCDGEKFVNFWVATIQTPFGFLDIPHTKAMVSSEQMEYMKPGCHLVAEGILAGDAAVRDFQGGAVFNEENCLRLLRSCLKYGDWERLENALGEDCVYRGEDGVSAGREVILDKLKASSSLPAEARKTLTRLASLAQAGAKFRAGKRCILAGSEEGGTDEDFIFLTTGQDGKIQTIDWVGRDKPDSYMAEPDSFEYGEYETFQPRHLNRSVTGWLEAFKNSYDVLSYGLNEIYFGLEPEVRLSAPGFNEEMPDKEDIFFYLEQAMIARKAAGRKPKTEIINLPDGRPALLILDGSEKYTLTLETSAKGRIARLDMKLEDGHP